MLFDLAINCNINAKVEGESRLIRPSPYRHDSINMQQSKIGTYSSKGTYRRESFRAPVQHCLSIRSIDSTVINI